MRNKTIDFFRGFAVILTLFRHSKLSDQCILKQIGWIGVDLFFVLSGFLVSGLIFDEYKKTKKFNGSLFLIRRGFKIYPSFWVLILFTIIFNQFLNIDISYKKIISELLFIQNYNDGIWNHTWSLAVEEHFYFLIVFVFIIIIKYFNEIEKPILVFTLLVILYGFIIKLPILPINNHYTFKTHMSPTHLRIDSLMVGLLLSYLYRFKRNVIQKILSKKIVLGLLIVIGISLPFFWSLDKHPQSVYMSCFGLSFLSWSFGLLLIYTIENKKFSEFISSIISKTIFNAIVKIGFYSYSIYLWHLFVRDVFYKIFSKFILLDNIYLGTALYMLVAILYGILLGKIIEIPFLKIREKYFPKKNN